MPINHVEKGLFFHIQKCLEFNRHCWNFEWNQVERSNEGFFPSTNTQDGFDLTEDNLMLASSTPSSTMDENLATSDKRTILGCVCSRVMIVNTYFLIHTNRGSVTTMFLTWPSQFPDLCYTGNLYNELKGRVHKRRSWKRFCRDLLLRHCLRVLGPCC